MPPSGGPEVEDDGLDRNLERLIFWGFCVNPFGIGPLHYVSSLSDFSFEFSEKFIIEKRLPDSPSRGVDKISYRYNFFQTFK